MVAAAFALGASAFAKATADKTARQWQESQRYPDPRIEILDPSFAQYRINSAKVERLATGMRWAEGPVWFGDGRYLLWSDIPNNRIMKWEEETGAVSVFRKPSNFSNGNTRDRQGRLLTCEHDTRRVTRTEYDGSITVLAERFEGKPLNSPNDIVVPLGRVDLVHGSTVRHSRQLRRTRGETRTADERLPPRSRHLTPRRRRRRHRQAQRPVLSRRTNVAST